MKTHVAIMILVISAIVIIAGTLIINNGSLNTMSTESANYDGTKSRIEFKKDELLMSASNWQEKVIVSFNDTIIQQRHFPFVFEKIADTIIYKRFKSMVFLPPQTYCRTITKKSHDSILIMVTNISVTPDNVIDYLNQRYEWRANKRNVRLHHSDGTDLQYNKVPELLSEFEFYITLPNDIFFINHKEYEQMINNLSAYRKKEAEDKRQAEIAGRLEIEQARKDSIINANRMKENSDLQKWLEKTGIKGKVIQKDSFVPPPYVSPKTVFSPQKK